MANEVQSINTKDVTAKGGKIDGEITFLCSDATFNSETVEITIPTTMGGDYVFTVYDREEHRHGVDEVDQFSVEEILHRTDSNNEDPIDELANHIIDEYGVVLLAEFSTPSGNETVLYVLDDAQV